ncbi:hypothetical protein T484DRAFT_1967563 [Baffinella frigidus]|nr:hypothetical protein T484DRAFT_1967563 [Cryptophyta sp. CCMP2293]
MPPTSPRPSAPAVCGRQRGPAPPLGCAEISSRSAPAECGRACTATWVLPEGPGGPGGADIWSVPNTSPPRDASRKEGLPGGAERGRAWPRAAAAGALRTSVRTVAAVGRSASAKLAAAWLCSLSRSRCTASSCSRSLLPTAGARRKQDGFSGRSRQMSSRYGSVRKRGCSVLFPPPASRPGSPANSRRTVSRMLAATRSHSAAGTVFMRGGCPCRFSRRSISRKRRRSSRSISKSFCFSALSWMVLDGCCACWRDTALPGCPFAPRGLNGEVGIVPVGGLGV